MSGIFGGSGSRVRSTVSGSPVSSRGLISGEPGVTVDNSGESPTSSNGLFAGESNTTIQNEQTAVTSSDGLFSGEASVVVRTVTADGGGSADGNTTYTLDAFDTANRMLTLRGSDGSTSVVTIPGGGQADGNTTYTISIVGRVVTLTVSDGSSMDITIPLTPIPPTTVSNTFDTTSRELTTTVDGVDADPVVIPGGGSADDTRTNLERFRDKIIAADTERRLVFANGLPSTITFDIDGTVGNVVGTFEFVNGLPRTITYTGAFVESLLGAGREFVKTFVFDNGLPQTITWTEVLVAMLELVIDRGRITETSDPLDEFSQDRGEITNTSSLFTEDRGRRTFTGA